MADDVPAKRTALSERFGVFAEALLTGICAAAPGRWATVDGSSWTTSGPHCPAAGWSGSPDGVRWPSPGWMSGPYGPGCRTGRSSARSVCSR